MGVARQFSTTQNCIKLNNKVPEYARDYKKEWLFIIGINKECYKYENNLEDGFYTSNYCKNLMNIIKRFLKKQGYGYLKDINNFFINKRDVFYIEDMNLFLKYDSLNLIIHYLNDDDYYNSFKEFYDLFLKFYNKLNILNDDDDDDDGEYIKTIVKIADPRNNIDYSDSDSNSDSDSDSDDLVCDSDSDSDSD